jgi:signal transduction histidine kinase
MSHELRTPLNAVIGYAELIEEEAERGPIAEDANKIRASARQLLGVIDVILDLSKLESGAIELEREQVEVAAVIEQLREAVLPLASVNRNKIEFREATALGSADVDHRRLYQCLMQLVSNAAKFTRDGEITITSARSVQNGRARLAFEVADTGIGIAAAQQERIFDPFVQGDDSSARRFEGTGLGLTLVRRLARLMGGDVTCESSPGKGSVFTLWVDAGT